MSLKSNVIPAYVLAGGQSTRFGSDKAHAIFNDQATIVRLMDELKRAGHAVTVVADRSDRYQDLGFDAIFDGRPAMGPLAGLETAIEHYMSIGRSGWILATSCDLVCWDADWSARLAECVNDKVDAVVFEDEWMQPLPGLYHTRSLLGIKEHLNGQQRSLRGLLDALGDRAKRLTAPTDGPTSWSFNTVEQLAKITCAVGLQRSVTRRGRESFRGND